MSLEEIRSSLRKVSDPKRAEGSRRYFKDSTGDIFLGVTTPACRIVARSHRALPLQDVKTLMHSPVHEERSVAHMILAERFRRGNDAEKKLVYDVLIKNRKTLTTWDAVDGTAPYIVGPYLCSRSKAILYRLAASRNLWDRRIAMVSTLYFIRNGQTGDAFRIAEKLLGDREDLIHKATGWMLREAGKKDMPALEAFLRKHLSQIPRTALRYAIERFPERKRQSYLKGTIRP